MLTDLLFDHPMVVLVFVALCCAGVLWVFGWYLPSLINTAAEPDVTEQPSHVTVTRGRVFDWERDG